MSANCHDGQGMEEVNGGGSGGAATSSAAGNNGFMLFGVRVMEGSSSFRKSVSMTNLGQYEQPHDSNADVAAGYASDEVFHSSARNRERKRGVPWTEEEHKLFLLGLQKVGKGDWRGISRNFVKTRTPTQVASHAQKYFLRRNNHNRRRRRRSSLFDITTDTFVGSAMEDKVHQETISPEKFGSNNLQGTLVPNFPVTLGPIILPIPEEDSIDDALTLGHGNQLTNTPKLIRPISIPPLPTPSSKMADLNLNQTTSPEPLPLALKLSPPSSSSDQQSQASRHPSAFQAISGSFNGSSGDSRISVA